MALLDKPNNNVELEGLTPATIALANIFFLMVFYFIIEIYFTADEYYAEGAPFLALIIGAGVVAGMVFWLLRKVESERQDSLQYALLLGFGAGLALYSLIPRINILTDKNGVHTYTYWLDSAYTWKAKQPALPELNIYLESSPWWQQFEPGDEYSFSLRKGGLGIWQVNMAKIYDEQKAFYDCDGVATCLLK